VLERAGGRPLTLRDIAERLGLERYDRRRLEAALAEQATAGRARRIGSSRWQWPKDRDARRGRDDRRGVAHIGQRRDGRDERDRAHRARGRDRDESPERRERTERRDREPRGDRHLRGRGEGTRADRYTRARRDHRDDGEQRGRGAPARPAGAPLEGRYTRARAGFGFVQVEGPARARFPRDLFIPEGMSGPALHGDRVRVEIVRRDARGDRASGRVTDVVRPGIDRVVGILEDARRSATLRGAARAARRGSREERDGGAPGRWWVVPQNDLLPIVQVAGGIEPGPFDAGKVALVRLSRRPDAARPPAGDLERVLGDPEDPEVQFLTVALENGLRVEFPPDVEREAATLPRDPGVADVGGREDLRDQPFVTIDGETARDFDDAVCATPLANGARLVRVAIADVSHYVRPGSALDAEARERGTSVYFPDRAIPMLPEALSNGLCSLVPERDRLVLVAEVELDRRGARRASRFYRGVIRSRARLTYTQVAAVLSATDTAAVRAQREEVADLLPELQQMRELMRVLYRRRVAAGSLDLDLPEALIDLSEEGRSIGVRFSPRNDAHRIIEELMLEANQAVAQFLADRDVPLPYRVHEPPDAGDVAQLNELLGAFGFAIELDGDSVRPGDVQRALAALEGHRLARVLSRYVLRALKLAHYSTENVGHFGLAFPIYCHFTSPIRRYPDLLVHRQLAAVLDGEDDAARERAAELTELSIASSQRERQAVDAERAMLDLKKAEFMLDHLLEPEPATITGVTKFGFFVELDACPIEGLVRADQLNERFELDESTQALVGTRTGARFRLGDRVRVEATEVSLRRRQVTFAVVEHLAREEDAGERRRKPARRPARKVARGRAR